jgi:hypothetical protein
VLVVYRFLRGFSPFYLFRPTLAMPPRRPCPSCSSRVRSWPSRKKTGCSYLVGVRVSWGWGWGWGYRVGGLRLYHTGTRARGTGFAASAPSSVPALGTSIALRALYGSTGGAFTQRCLVLYIIYKKGRISARERAAGRMHTPGDSTRGYVDGPSERNPARQQIYRI